MPMLFLSGATVPAAMLPHWAQTLAQFMPASYLVSGFQGIFFRHRMLLHADAVPLWRHRARGDAPPLGADPGAVHAGLLPGQRFPGHLLPPSESLGQRPGRRRATAHYGARLVPGDATVPLGEGRKNPAAQQTLGGGRAGAVRRHGYVAVV